MERRDRPWVDATRRQSEALYGSTNLIGHSFGGAATRPPFGRGERAHVLVTHGQGAYFNRQ